MNFCVLLFFDSVIRLNYLLESFIMGAMKDLIEERNKKEKIQHSIVKWWNVHYMTPEELAEAQKQEAEADTSDSSQRSSDRNRKKVEVEKQLSEEEEAEEIIERLQREAEEDEARKQEEIEMVRREVEASYNQKTGSYSGSYGSHGADFEHEGQINAILAEKDDALRDLIEHTEVQEQQDEMSFEMGVDIE